MTCLHALGSVHIALQRHYLVYHLQDVVVLAAKRLAQLSAGDTAAAADERHDPQHIAGTTAVPTSLNQCSWLVGNPHTMKCWPRDERGQDGAGRNGRGVLLVGGVALEKKHGEHRQARHRGTQRGARPAVLRPLLLRKAPRPAQLRRQLWRQHQRILRPVPQLLHTSTTHRTLAHLL